MLKDNAKVEQYQPELDRQDALALRERAADDVREDADLYISKAWPQENRHAGASALALVRELYRPNSHEAGTGSPQGIEGSLTHSVGGATSDELLKIFLSAKVEVLSTQSLRIFRDNISWSGKYVGWMKQVL